MRAGILGVPLGAALSLAALVQALAALVVVEEELAVELLVLVGVDHRRGEVDVGLGEIDDRGHQVADHLVAGLGRGAALDAAGDLLPGVLVEVDESLKRAGLANALEEIKPDGAQLLRVALQNVAFDQVAPWLGYLNKRGIEVTSSVINRIEDTPRVNLRLTLESKAG